MKIMESLFRIGMEGASIRDDLTLKPLSNSFELKECFIFILPQFWGKSSTLLQGRQVHHLKIRSIEERQESGGLSMHYKNSCPPDKTGWNLNGAESKRR